MRLARKLTVALVLGVFLVLAISGYAQIRRDKGMFENDVRRDHHTMGRVLAAAIAGVWRSEGRDRARRLVEEANERESNVDIRWVWPEAATGDPDAPRASGQRLGALHALEVVVEKLPDQNGQRLLTYVPVRLPDQTVGAIEFSETLAGEQQFIRTTVTNTLASTALLTIVCGAITSAVGLWLVGRPMRRLIDHARRIGAGDLSSRIALVQHDEVGELASEMNRMSERLAAAQERLASETAARIAALEQLRHAERLATVGKLASGIAHALGAPLQIVAGRAQMIAECDVTGAEVPDNGRLVVAEVQRMTRIIRQLLDFARRRTATKQPLDLAGLVHETCALLRPLAEKQGVRLVVCDQRQEPAICEVDHEQVQQALTNVVVNGIQAMPAGGSLRMGIVAAAGASEGDAGDAEELIGVFVEDEGEGIDHDAISHVFEPFFTTKPVGEGTGLGLSVAYGIVKEHGGRIDVQSQPGSGSRFTLLLPRANA